jgi:hypothetical protein
MAKPKPIAQQVIVLRMKGMDLYAIAVEVKLEVSEVRLILDAWKDKVSKN